MDTELEKKITFLQDFTRLRPKDRDALALLAGLLLLAADYPAALQAAMKLQILDPAYAEGFYLAAQAEMELGGLPAAAGLLEKALALQPQHMEVCRLLAKCYGQLRQLDERREVLQKILASDRPAGELLAWAWRELGGDELLLGNITAAREAFWQSSRRGSSPAEQCRDYSSYLMCTNYDDSMTGEEMLRAHRKTNDFFAGIKPFARRRRPAKKKIRVGYLSADLYHHAMSYFLYPLLHSHNSDEFEIFCYQRNLFCDDATEQLQGGAAIWRDVASWKPAAAARQIYEDEIDILVELGGHTADNGLAILAHRPAPVQVCALGYINTTGLAAVDYFLTDTHIDPPGQEEDCFSETLWRLPHTQWCYVPRIGAPACRAAAAVQRNGYVTFCCFNNFAKITDSMLLVWREILHRLPAARLVLKNKVFQYPAAAAAVTARLQQLGLPLERIEFRPATAGHLQEYLDMDIALDTFPYQGGVTTCEALYMGVPVITLAGRHHRSRFGCSMLRNVGLEDCIAGDEAAYIEKAVALAGDRERLNLLHGGRLRESMKNSPLMDPVIYMQELEAAYHRMYQQSLG